MKEVIPIVIYSSYSPMSVKLLKFIERGSFASKRICVDSPEAREIVESSITFLPCVILDSEEDIQILEGEDAVSWFLNQEQEEEEEENYKSEEIGDTTIFSSPKSNADNIKQKSNSVMEEASRLMSQAKAENGSFGLVM